MAGPWLSVLVPVYNVLPFVEECLSSILAQMDGDPGIELILLDDASTDGSADLCESILAGHSGYARLMRHPANRGLSAARNTMLEAASGEYVWFIDSDDTMLPGAIASLRAILAGARPDVVVCDYKREGDAVYRSFAGPEQAVSTCTHTLVAGTFKERRLHAWSRIWKRTLFGQAIRFPEGACFEDVATVPWLLLKASSFYYTAEPWIYYRSRPDSIMARLNKSRAAFDTRSHDDLAVALTGFGHAVQALPPGSGPDAQAAVSRFLAREFVKIAKRLVRGLGRHAIWEQVRAEIGRYRTSMEACSCVPFKVVAMRYVRKGQLVRAAALGLSLAAAGPCRLARPAPLPGRGG